MTPVLAAMVLDGFQASREPFVISLLQLWRAWSIKYLKEKAKLVVHQGAILLGCIDESKKLRGFYTPHNAGGARKTDSDALPEIFVQLSKGAHGKPQVLEGIMGLGRNPSLHPGDIRIVKGVDIPELRHLKDVVVLPQTGDRDLAGMCSGGDLDGDDFFVIWDPDLIPRNWHQEAIDYTPPPPKIVERNVTIDDITSFFVTYMKNDSLGRIANAHLATADRSSEGVYDRKCKFQPASKICLTFRQV